MGMRSIFKYVENFFQVIHFVAQFRRQSTKDCVNNTNGDGESCKLRQLKYSMIFIHISTYIHKAYKE